MDIKVLGTGCANCKATIALIIQVTQDKGLQAEVSKAWSQLASATRCE
ncbi:thioredoxin family protein [Burkholderia cenocepacia]|nr:thioredoxin family protein [Burkholderia cenocepacia]MCW5177339.1 thioredoxin family protein [Burkholderia cenocepacia]